ncbi:esterase/lipase family protein [Sorangium sp. So ce861]|uniref:esterase/lipase family protein n=1 Tax=Sorangium sp. So ce861 TaxID=3133323 RepID=UPI003F61A43E
MLEQLRLQLGGRHEEPKVAPEVRDVVVLVPGFLGFDHFGGFFYFADRVCGALRGALEVKLGRPGLVPVIPVTSRPTASLAECQASLIVFLKKVVQQFPSANLHLVGHSTGGVHAQLLTSARPQGKDRWDEEDLDPVIGWRPRIRSVISLCAPHWGTYLAHSDLARLVSSGVQPGSVTAIPPLFNLLRLTVVESALSAFDLTFATVTELWGFFLDVGNNRKLIDALTPESMAEVRDRDRSAGPRHPARLRSFVTVANASDDSDPFFVDLHRRAANTASGAPSRVAAEAIRRLEDELRLHAQGGPPRPCRVIKFPDSPAGPISPSSNDGVVNSAHQLVDPASPEELAAIVVADHADVIGHYDRWELRAARPGEEVGWSRFKRGLFRSGSRFRDEQFFELYAAIADELLPAMTAGAARSSAHPADRADRARPAAPSAPPPAEG